VKTPLLHKVIVYAIVIAGALLFVFPFIYMILTTFFQGTNTLPKPDQVLSVKINFANYITVWNKNNFVNYCYYLGS